MGAGAWLSLAVITINCVEEIINKWLINTAYYLFISFGLFKQSTSFYLMMCPELLMSWGKISWGGGPQEPCFTISFKYHDITQIPPSEKS